MGAFTVYPAIDLRGGKVVRLAQGDPNRQTVYGQRPAGIARRWVSAGAAWLHVINLDGAFGGKSPANRAALEAILSFASSVHPRVAVQFGGGLRSLADVETALSLGVVRVILGTVAVETPELITEAIARFGPDKIGVGIDTRDGMVMVHGWTEDSGLEALAFGKQLRAAGVSTVIFTNVARDGMGTGVDVATARRLADEIGLDVIAAGGVGSLSDVQRVRAAGLSGVIVGRALYEGQVTLEEALKC